MGSRLEANSSAVRKRIEKHKFDNEEGEEYESSKFGGFTDYFRRKKIKLQNLDASLRSSTANNPPIFRGVVAHVNGYTQPSLNDLHNLVVSYGGGFMQYLDGKTTVTHIIASNLTPKKKIEFSKYRIVKPAWVVDSIEAGKLLPWDAYRVVDEGIGQRVLGFDNGSVVNQVNNLPAGYKDQTERSWYTGQVRDVAEELNAHDPEWPYPSTQLPLECSGDNETDDKIQDSSSGKLNDRVEGSPESSSLRGDTPEFDFGPDILPAADQPLIDFQPDQSLPEVQMMHTSDHAATASLKDSQPLNAVHVADESGIPDKPEALSVADLLLEDRDSGRTRYKEIDVEHEPEFQGTNSQDETSPGSPERISPKVDDGLKKSVFGAHGSPTKPTPEEHNALLLADPRVWKSTVVNPGFLKQYYEESRLHHLSAWKADLKSQLQKLAAEKSSSQSTREKRVPSSRRYILHVDFDSFFAAVSLKKYPQYVERPVVIAHGGGSGSEIASCNYPARKFGIKNGMWMKHAQKMCPDLKVLPYDFKAYEDASRGFYDAVMDTGGIVQSVSVDEALVDVSARCVAAGGHDGKGIHEGSIWREQTKAEEIAEHVRKQVKEKTGCAVSVGIGGNILLAKVALRKAKPAGQYHIKPEEILEFLGGLTVQELPGVAYSIGGKLEEIGVRYVKDVRELSKEKMINTLGPKTGEKIWDYSRGIDRTEVGEQVVRKSVSAEVNWGIRFVTQEQAEEFIQSLCEELHKRLVTEQVKGKQLTMKIMRRAADAPLDPPKHLGHGKCDTFNKSLILGVATYDKDVLGREAISILRGFGFSPGELRGLGVQMQRLEPLKGSTENPQDGSQKRLKFKTSTATGPKPALPRHDTIVDDIESPLKPRVPLPPHPAAAFAREMFPSGTPRKPLNILGTQFVMPTQVDPDVLAELPSDIRSKLLRQNTESKPETSRDPIPAARSRSGTPALPPDAIPTHSQLDQETLDALPDDVRAEILAFYHKSPHKPSAQVAQALLPQSPRKTRTIKLPKKLTTPTKRRTGLLGRGGKHSTSAFSTLTQSNFVANARPGSSSSNAHGGDVSDIPDDFLSALPEDIRREVLAQARRDRLQKKGGIDVTSKKRRPPNPANLAPRAKRTLKFPPPPPKPTFTAQKYSQLPELRQAISAWFEEFREEGPYTEDVDALVAYLGKVVGEERDMTKAIGVVRWLEWVVGEGSGDDRKGVWEQTVDTVKGGVQVAVEKRGLGRLEL